MPLKASNFSLQILTQPPTEQRTRTAKEKRLFKTSVRVHIKDSRIEDSMVSLQVIALLLYADKTTTNRVPEAKTLTVRHGNLLGGTICKNLLEGKSSKSTKTCTKTDAIYIDIVFEDLNLNEPSSRHHDREFCIAYKLIDARNKRILAEVESGACYAYSHPKVLKRRRNIVLKALSTMQVGQNALTSESGCKMHAVGGPFIQSPRLRVLFQFVWRKNGKVFSKKSCYADNLELFSENVLFFDAPAFPFCAAVRDDVTNSHFFCHVSISNDSRHFSNQLEVTYPSIYKVMRVESPGHPTCCHMDLAGSCPASRHLNSLPQVAHQGSLIFNEANKSGKVWTVEKKSAERDDDNSMEVTSACGTKRSFSPGNKEEFEAFDFEEILFLEDDIFFDDSADSVPFAEPLPMPLFCDDSGSSNLSLLDNVSEALYDVNAEKPKRKRMRSRM